MRLSQLPNARGVVMIPILEMHQLRLREFKWLDHGGTVRKWPPTSL